MTIFTIASAMDAAKARLCLVQLPATANYDLSMHPAPKWGLYS